jgi:hypothetical protein
MDTYACMLLHALHCEWCSITNYKSENTHLVNVFKKEVEGTKK